MLSRFDTTPDRVWSDTRTDRHLTIAESAPCISQCKTTIITGLPAFNPLTPYYCHSILCHTAWVKQSFVIFDIGALWRLGLVVRVPGCQKLHKWRLNPVWHRMLYICTHMATVGVKGLRRFDDMTCLDVVAVHNQFLTWRWLSWSRIALCVAMRCSWHALIAFPRFVGVRQPGSRIVSSENRRQTDEFELGERYCR